MTFCKVWWPIYTDDPHWVPPLLLERKRFFDPKQNPFFANADVQCFIASRDGRDVGTIAATVDHTQQESDSGLGLFGFFEFIDDPSVSRALFDAACAWLTERGMTSIRGPFNFSSNHEFGLLVDGFDTDPCIANPHNSAYYVDHYEALPLTKIMDWFAYWLDNDGPTPDRISRIGERFLKRRPDITLRKVDLRHAEREAALMYEIYNDAWEDNWGHVHLSLEEFEFSVKNMKDIVNPDLIWFAYVGDECAGFTITLPDFNQVAKKMNGRLFPFGWWHFLRGRSRIDTLRVFVLGIRRKYQKLPLGAPLYMKTWEEGRKMGVRGAEASLILEDNHRMRGALEKLGGRVYKTYRTYERPLGEAAPSAE